MSHFYQRTENGIKPRHFVENKSGKNKGKLRASTLRDAKSALKRGERWLPSVTTIQGILDKPGLNNWKVDQHLQTFLDLMYMDNTGCNVALGEIEPEWDDEKILKFIKGRTQERLDLAPKAGTDIHQVLEDYFTGSGFPDVGTELTICKNVEQGLRANGILALNMGCEKYFTDDSIGYAGCADVITIEGDSWVIDYKSKQEASKFKPGKMAYPEHAQQLAAYGKAFFDGKFRAANIFICLETGEIDFHEHSWEELERGFEVFKHALEIYKITKYNPLEDKI